MARKTDTLRYPLSAALPTPSALAVLRVLARASRDYNVRQVARLAGINHATCASTLAQLETAKIVERSQIGRSVVYRLDDANAIVSELIFPLFVRERAIMDDIEGEIRRQFASCLKIVLDGATAGRGSVTLLTADKSPEGIRRTAEEMAAGLEERYGFQIEFRVFTLDDAPIDLF